eukprot:CAMPEP_0170610826 /NCGR_PEP_ID=MMETSP0224-20130122/22868_1 /TAXON_ID=285029 /ORGANISM="Togula jolla, Strain CCCM 725" /LENGTH=354 /DNA_ID=CAMNT_0010936231 /DNA_START=50 /DNA_END=1114 /DNA_ORIENTATION=+
MTAMEARCTSTGGHLQRRRGTLPAAAGLCGLAAAADSAGLRSAPRSSSLVGLATALAAGGLVWQRFRQRLRGSLHTQFGRSAMRLARKRFPRAVLLGAIQRGSEEPQERRGEEDSPVDDLQTQLRQQRGELGDDLRSLSDEIPASEADASRDDDIDMEDELWDELKEELRETVKDELRVELEDDVWEALSDAMEDTVRQELKETLEESVRRGLVLELKAEMQDELRLQMDSEEETPESLWADGVRPGEEDSEDLDEEDSDEEEEECETVDQVLAGVEGSPVTEKQIAALKEKLAASVKQELRKELRDKVWEELSEELAAEVAEELRSDLQDDTREELRDELRDEVRQDLKWQLG